MPHILITDDDPHLRRLVRTYAELEGYDCTEAGDGAAAVTALKPSKRSAASAKSRSSC